MRVIIGCECSGRVRDAFTRNGHFAMSCDTKPSEAPGEHFQGDIFEAIERWPWDLLIVHPPCTYLCSSGLHWNGRQAGRQAGKDGRGP